MEKLKVKAGYYIPQLPTKIALTLLDGTTRITDLTPARWVKEEELQPLAAFESGAWGVEHLEEWYPFVYCLYGLEKEEYS